MELTIEQPFDLGSSLESGQAHRWKKCDDWYSGVVRGDGGMDWSFGVRRGLTR